MRRAPGCSSLVLIPDGKIAWGKLSQAMDYGAVTCQLKADFDGCLTLLTQIVKEAPIYLLNSVNPYRLEGQKTPAFEIAEAFDWNVPDHLIVPGGNLGNSSALGKGFREMHELGLVARMPRISRDSGGGGQSAGAQLGRESGGDVAGAGGGAHAGHGHSHRQSGLVAQGGAGDSGDGRLVPGCDRGRDRHCQGGDRRRGAGLRTGLGGDAGGAEEAARRGQDRFGRDGGSGADRPHAQGRRLHHRLPSRNAADGRGERGPGGGDRRPAAQCACAWRPRRRRCWPR